MNSIRTQPEDIVSSGTRRSFLRSRKFLVLLGLLAFFLIFARFAGSLLVRDRPEKSDVIVVLAGDSQDERFNHGMELLRAGYGKHLFVDAASDSHFFGRTPADYAEAYVKQEAKEMAAQVSVCPFQEDSTRTETRYVAQCLQTFHPGKVLLVTSDWHSARALSVFVRLVPQYHWSVAAAHDDDVFGTHWWRRREWAKTTFQEWLKVVWWNAIDRWRSLK